MNDVWHQYGLAVTALLIKGLCLSVAQAWLRVRHRVLVTPEDARLLGVPAQSSELPSVTRLSAAWRNEVENAPLFLGAAAAYAALGGPVEFSSIYFSVFVMCRYLHTFAYARALQPLRFYCWAGGQLASFATAMHALMLA